MKYVITYNIDSRNNSSCIGSQNNQNRSSFNDGGEYQARRTFSYVSCKLHPGGGFAVSISIILSKSKTIFVMTVFSGYKSVVIASIPLYSLKFND